MKQEYEKQETEIPITGDKGAVIKEKRRKESEKENRWKE